jgi:hypothetical protein
MKRLVQVIVAALLLTLAVAAPAAAAAHEAATHETTVTTTPKGFTLSWTTCSNLPVGTVITGTGIEKSVTTQTSRGGITTVSNVTHTTGTATSNQDDNTYRFSYDNAFRVSDRKPGQLPFSGTMLDLFTITGSGPATLANGFVARITTDFTNFTFDPISSFGDPIDFPTGETRCDPL